MEGGTFLIYFVASCPYLRERIQVRVNYLINSINP